MAIGEVSITPIGTGSTSVSKYVAACHQILLADKKVSSRLTPMGTILEGELDDILAVIKKMHEVPFACGAKRVATLIKIDDRRDKVGSMEQKIKSVEEKMR